MTLYRPRAGASSPHRHVSAAGFREGPRKDCLEERRRRRPPGRAKARLLAWGGSPGPCTPFRPEPRQPSARLVLNGLDQAGRDSPCAPARNPKGTAAMTETPRRFDPTNPDDAPTSQYAEAADATTGPASAEQGLGTDVAAPAPMRPPRRRGAPIPPAPRNPRLRLPRRRPLRTRARSPVPEWSGPRLPARSWC